MYVTMFQIAKEAACITQRMFQTVSSKRHKYVVSVVVPGADRLRSRSTSPCIASFELFPAGSRPQAY